MLGASALIAVTSLLAKALGLGIEGPPLHPMQISAGRFFFAFLALVLLLPWLRPSFAGTAWGLQASRSLFGWLGVSCLFAAAARMPLADATAISFLSPPVTMLAAILFLGDRVGVVRWSAAAISLVGAVILIRPGTSAFQPAAVIALAAALFMGLEAVLIKRLTTTEPPVRILLVNNAFGSLIACSAAAMVWITPGAAQLGLMALLGVTMLTAQSLFIQAMKGAEASYVIPFFYATLVFATLYDYLLFGALPDGWGAAGAVIILTGSLLLALRDQKARAR